MEYFKKYLIENNIKHEIKGNNLIIGGYLDLRGTNITTLPDNLTIGGSLALRGTNITTLPDNLKVGGSLDITGTDITDLPDNLTIGSNLDLRNTDITTLPDNLTVGGYFDLENTSITELPDNLKVGGYLDITGTSITDLPDNLTIGGYLDLRGTNITTLPNNLTIGGSLYLSGTSITDLPDNLIIGGSLYLRGTNITAKQAKKVRKVKNYTLEIESKLIWENGRYRKIDNIFCEVIRELKSCLKVKIGLQIKYVVFDGEYYAHGNTLKEAREDLIYKRCNRDKSEYEKMTIDTVLPLKDCIEMYRVITGACSSGTKHFVKSLDNVKKKYSIKELIEITKDQYGSDTLIRFFNRQKG